jgi:hypothetical protein
MSTPIYGFRYPALSDAPNGPLQIEHLAEDVEGALNLVAANADAALAAAKPRLFEGISNADVSGTANIPGATVTFTVAQTTSVHVTGIFDVATNTTQTAVGLLVVDGSNRIAEAHYVGLRGTCAQTWALSLSAGTHTLGLRQTTSTTTTFGTHTKISCLVLGS